MHETAEERMMSCLRVLWARISEQTNMGNIVARISYRPPNQEKVIRSSSENWRKPYVNISWASWGHPDNLLEEQYNRSQALLKFSGVC